MSWRVAVAVGPAAVAVAAASVALVVTGAERLGGVLAAAGVSGGPPKVSTSMPWAAPMSWDDCAAAVAAVAGAGSGQGPAAAALQQAAFRSASSCGRAAPGAGLMSMGQAVAAVAMGAGLMSMGQAVAAYDCCSLVGAGGGELGPKAAKRAPPPPPPCRTPAGPPASLPPSTASTAPDIAAFSGSASGFRPWARSRSRSSCGCGWSACSPLAATARSGCVSSVKSMTSSTLDVAGHGGGGALKLARPPAAAAAAVSVEPGGGSMPQQRNRGRVEGEAREHATAAQQRAGGG